MKIIIEAGEEENIITRVLSHFSIPREVTFGSGRVLGMKIKEYVVVVLNDIIFGLK